MQARNPKKWLKQTGQASIEYILVSILAVFILIKPDDQGDVPIVKLANALKTYYHGYAYAISMSDTTTLPSELIEIIAVTAVTGGGGGGAVQNPVTPQNNAGPPLPDFIPPGVITPPPAIAPITPPLNFTIYIIIIFYSTVTTFAKFLGLSGFTPFSIDK